VEPQQHQPRSTPHAATGPGRQRRPPPPPAARAHRFRVPAAPAREPAVVVVVVCPACNAPA